MKKTRIQSILAGLFRPLFPALVITCACGLLGTLSGNREIRLPQFACLYLLAFLFGILFSRKHHALIFACGLLAFALIAYRFREVFGREVCLFVSRYLEYLNPYYHKSLGLLEPWNSLASEASGTAEVTAFLAVFGLWTGCAPFASGGRIGVCGLWLLAAAAAGMAVGLTPDGMYFPLGLAALLLWLLIRRSGSLPASALIFLLAGALALAAVPLTDRIPAESVKLSIRGALESAASRIRLPGAGGTMTTGIGSGDLGQAGELVQDDSDALAVRMEEKPEQTVYLAAYTGSTYENNRWEPVPESELAAETGFSSGEVWSLYEENWMGGGSVSVTVEIRGAAARFLYHPYASALPGNGENAAGDAYIGRRGSLSDAFQVPLLLLSGTADEWQSLSDSLADEEDPYRTFAEEHNGDLQDGEWGVLQNWLTRRLPEAEMSDVEKASWVRELLAQTADYSLSPGTVSERDNAIIWFLTGKQEGFCMHFASAGTVLLRMWGVTARYAEGYLIDPSDFRQTEDGDWEAVVKNRAAHAWTEIFLPGLGWVPMEMTPGFGDGSEDLSESVQTTVETTAEETGEEPMSTTRSEELSETGTADEETGGNEAAGTRADAPSAESADGTGGETMDAASAAPETDTFPFGRILLISGIFLTVTVLAVMIRAFRPRAGIRRRPRRSSDSRTAVLRLGQEILSCCIRRGMPASLSFTSPDFPGAAAAFFTEEELARLTETKEIVNRAEFGYNQLEDEDYRKVWECFRLISKRNADGSRRSSVQNQR